MTRLIELLVKLRDVAAVAGILGLGVEHLDQRALSRLLTRLRQIDVALIVGQQRIGDVDLLADGRDRQHLIDDATGKREMRCLCLPPLRLGLGDALFGLATKAAEQIEIVADPSADRIEVELGIAAQSQRW